MRNIFGRRTKKSMEDELYILKEKVRNRDVYIAKLNQEKEEMKKKIEELSNNYSALAERLYETQKLLSEYEKN